MAKEAYRRKSSFGLRVQRVRVHDGKAWQQEQEDHILDPKHKADRAQLEWAQTLKPPVTHFLRQGTPPKPTSTPTTGDQVCPMPETMGNISVKAPQGPYQELIWFSVPVCASL